MVNFTDLQINAIIMFIVIIAYKLRNNYSVMVRLVWKQRAAKHNIRTKQDSVDSANIAISHEKYTVLSLHTLNARLMRYDLTEKVELR